MRYPFPLLALALSLLSASGSAAAVSVRDDLGALVTVPRPARRVVTLAPSTAELLYAVGAGPELVGVPSEADYPPEVKRLGKIGSYSNPDPEAIIAMKPDLAVVAFGNPRPLLDQLRARKIPVYVSHPKTVAQLLASMRGLGKLTGHPAQGEQTARGFEKRLSAVTGALKGRPPVRSVVMVWDQPITVAGSGAFLHDVLRLAGGVNAAGDLAQPYPTVDPEQFTVRNPAAIVFAGHDATRVREAAGRPGIRSTAAARNRRIFAVPEDFLIRPGPRLIEGIERTARGLHPEAFRGRAKSSVPKGRYNREVPTGGPVRPGVSG